MDKEAALRKQITEELESEFESRLKQIKRQREQAQEELESASERWRSEKRRLNSEIDRLEGALTEARNSKTAWFGSIKGSTSRSIMPRTAICAWNGRRIN